MRSQSIAKWARRLLISVLLFAAICYTITEWRRIEYESLLGARSRYHYSVTTYRNSSFGDYVNISGMFVISEEHFAVMCRDLGATGIEWSIWQNRVSVKPYPVEFQALSTSHKIYIAHHKEGGNLRLAWLGNGTAAFWYTQVE